MLRAVIKKELLCHLVSFRFLVSTLIMLVLAALAAFVGTRDYSLRYSHHEARLAKNSESLQEVYVYSHLHPMAARAPEPLSVLHRGFDARLGTEVQLDVFSIPTAAVGGSAGEELGHSFRDLDLTTIVRVVLGLLALLLTFDAVIGERERSTLRLIFANGISRSKLIAGKYLGALFALLVPLLAGSAVSLLILLDRGGFTLGVQRWPRLAGLLLVYAAYLSVMLLLGLLLSTSARTTSSALVYSLLSWLAIVFLIPQAAIAVADVVQAESNGSPAVTEVFELVAERDRKLSAAEAALESIPVAYRSPVVESNATRGVLFRFGSARYYNARADFHARETAIGMDYAERIFELEQRVDRHRLRIASLVTVLASPSPAFLMDRIAASQAGTSVEDHEGFLEDSRELRRRFIEYLEQHDAFTSWRWFTDDGPNDLKPWTTLLGVAPEAVDAAAIETLVQRFQGDDVQRRVRETKESFRENPARRLELGDLPDLRLTFPGFWDACRRVAAEIVLLLSANGLLAGAVWWRFARYPLR